MLLLDSILKIGTLKALAVWIASIPLFLLLPRVDENLALYVFWLASSMWGVQFSRANVARIAFLDPRDIAAWPRDLGETWKVRRGRYPP